MRFHPVFVATLFVPIPALLVSADEAVSRFAGSEWRPLQIQGYDADPELRQTIQFGGNGTASGHGGCNHIAGQYVVNGSELTFSALAMTRRACSPETMQAEQSFVSTLEQVGTFQRDATVLDLFDPSGKLIMKLQQTDWD